MQKFLIGLAVGYVLFSGQLGMPSSGRLVQIHEPGNDVVDQLKQAIIKLETMGYNLDF